jgi:hypothetical protein
VVRSAAVVWCLALAIPLASPRADAGPVEAGPAAGAVDFSPPRRGTWGRRCGVYRRCDTPGRTIDPCPAGTEAPLWSEIAGAGRKLAGTVVSVKGSLTTIGAATTHKGCEGTNACCNAISRQVVVGTGPGMIAVDGLRCSGGESRACCPVAMEAQTVVVTGKLVRDRSGLPLRWRLAAGPRLCAIAGATR